MVFIEAKWPIYYKGGPNFLGKNRAFLLREKVAFVFCYLGSRGSLETCTTS